MSDTTTIGFAREEMFAEKLAGKSQPPLMRHVFVVAATSATEWANDYLEEPVKTLAAALDKKKFRVTAVEKVAGDEDQVGDLLVFPDFCRLRLASDIDTLAAVVARLADPAPLSSKDDDLGYSPLTKPQAFVCAHTARDARCGYCGPELCAAFASLGDAASVSVRKCSHIGGHVYAGNVITYALPSSSLQEQSQGDWFGYVQPKDVPVLHSWLLAASQNEKSMPHELHKLWRGRAGVSQEEHISMCQSCTHNDDVEDSCMPTSSKANVLFILGAPGSGKGTQCANLVRDYDLVHLSAGDLLRDERNNPHSQDGQLIETYIREGKIVPVAITVKLLWQAMQKHMNSEQQRKSNFLVDGFPRNQDNLEGWLEQLPESKVHVVGVLFLDCAEDIVRARLLERGKTSGRSDDNLESIMKRFKTFVGETMPIVQHFAKLGQCWSLDSSRPILDVYADVKKVIDENVIVVKGGSKESKKKKKQEKKQAAAVAAVTTTTQSSNNRVLYALAGLAVAVTVVAALALSSSSSRNSRDD